MLGDRPVKSCDVIVIGAGIIGAACAWQLAKRGQSVTLIDNGQPGATAAGMGHLVCMDDDPAELALSAWSLARWRAITPRMPDACAWRGCGTLWLAESEEEMAVAGEKQRRLAGYQVHSELQTPQQIAGREPLLRSGLAGGLWVPGDGIVYAPNVARWRGRCRRPSHLPARQRAGDYRTTGTARQRQTATGAGHRGGLRT